MAQKYKPLIIGHRGAKSEIMENTLESVLYSIGLGVDGIEIDVQTCRTGEVVLFHDDNLSRTAFKDKFYFDRTEGKKISELQWYHLYNTELIDSLGRKYKIPKLVDILSHPTVFGSDVLINIEIKDKISHERVISIVSDLIDEGLYEPDRFMISSFHLEPLIYSKEFKDDLIEKEEGYKSLKIGLILAQEDQGEDDPLTVIETYSDTITHVVLENCMLDRNQENKTVKTINSMGLKVFVYTVNSIKEYQEKSIDSSCAGIITDNPSLFLKK